ncbi:MAG: LacI family DNA-binding transcriptional regulator [Hydrogenoanaerobacterium sp.]
MADVNIKDIARLAGVGVSTVSRVINNHPDVNKETKARILKIIAEESYVPNNSARNLKRSQSNTVGVLIKGITNPFFSRMIKIIEKEISRYKYTMILHQVDADLDEVDVAIELSMEKKLRGIIFLGGCFSHSPAKLAALKVPFVLTTITTLGEGADKSRFSSVSIDDYAEAYNAVDYICKAGHRKIAIIGAQQNDKSIGWLRLKGYRDALHNNGITLDENRIIFSDKFSLSCGYNAARRLLEKTSFTCIFCISDILAMGAAKALISLGKAIPKDVSIMGFDGLEMAQYYSPSITTIYQPDEEMALCSVQTLMDVLEHDGQHRHLLFKAKLLEGESFTSIKV